MSNTTPQSRKTLNDVVTDTNIPPEVRLPALQALTNLPNGLFDNEYRALLQLVKNLSAEELQIAKEDASPAKFGELLLSLLTRCESSEVQRECLATLRGLLLDPVAAKKLRSAMPGAQGGVENLPVAKRLKQLLANPSAVAADILRDDLIAIRDRQIRGVLRDKPLIREAFAVIAQHSPVLRDLLSRRREFYLAPSGEYKSPELGFEATRKFTAAFVSVCSTKEGRDLLRVAIDACNRRARDEFWNAINNDPQYSVPELVVGSGPSSVNWRSTMLTLNPNRPSVVIDAQGYAGGQFAAVLDAVFDLNSRARPFGSIVRENLPGTESPLNTLGPYCAVQESDLSGAVYGDQTNIGLAIETNHLLAGGVVCNTALTRWNTFQTEDGKIRFIVELRRTDTGELGRVQADRLVFARGLGAPRCAFRTNDESQNSTKKSPPAPPSNKVDQIIDEELAAAQAGRFARYRTFPQFLRDIGDRSNPFPLKDMDTVAVIGAGDSGNVTVEALLGYGPFRSKAPQELDRVKRIDWYGQQSLTKEDFEGCTRNRYAQIANDFPRKSNRNADYRIEPMVYKAMELARADDGKLTVTDQKGKARTYDLVIDCSGFEQQEVADYLDPQLSPEAPTSEPETPTTDASVDSKLLDFKTLSQDNTTPTRLALTNRGMQGPATFVGEAKFITRVSFNELDSILAEKFVLCIEDAPGDSPVVFKDRDVETWRGFLPLQSLPTGDSSLSIKACLDGYVTAQSLEELREDPLTPRLLLFSNKQLKRIQKTSREIRVVKTPPPKKEPSLDLVQYVGTLNGEQVALAAGFRDMPLYIIGPEARLKISEAEQKKLQVNFIAENIVAVFLYSGRITTLAELVAIDDRKLFGYAPLTTASRRGEAKLIKYNPTVYDLKDTGFSEPTSAVNRLLGRTMSRDTLVGVVDTFMRYAFRERFPTSSETLEITLGLQALSGSPQLSISTSHPFAEPVYNDPVLARACYLLLTQPPFKNKAVDNKLRITVPVAPFQGTEPARFQILWNRATHENLPGKLDGKNVQTNIASRTE